MKIREKTPGKETRFKDLAYGDLFRFSANGRVHMKVRGLYTNSVYSCPGDPKPRDAHVTMDTGEVVYPNGLMGETMILPVDGEFVEA